MAGVVYTCPEGDEGVSLLPTGESIPTCATAGVWSVDRPWWETQIAAADFGALLSASVFILALAYAVNHAVRVITNRR